ncbi:MAG: hypothetical protein ACRC6H_03600 [Culicoidibacterales bacterium]
MSNQVKHQSQGFLLLEMCAALVLVMMLATSCATLIWFLVREQQFDQARKAEFAPWLMIEAITNE